MAASVKRRVRTQAMVPAIHTGLTVKISLGDNPIFDVDIVGDN